MVDGPHGPHLPYTEFENAAPLARFSVVVAHLASGLIGKNNALPWATNQKDMERFRAITSTTHRPAMKNAVIMGRKTWESMHCRPLPDRVNIVVTSRAVLDGVDGTVVLKTTSLMDALRTCEALSHVDRVFVIGGARLYDEALGPDCVDGCDYVFSTLIHGHDDHDGHDHGTDPVAVVDFKEKWARSPAFSLLWQHVADPATEFFTYGSRTRRMDTTTVPDKCVGYPHPHEECQYLCLVDSILRRGVASPDRTGTGTLSQFGTQLRFCLRDHVLPLLTTKKTFFRGVKEELMSLFVPGVTDVTVLREKNVHIWDGTVAASGGSTDMGPMYGFQWRHFGAEYTTCADTYAGKGVDQLAWVLEEIKTNPASRRLVVSAWNPVDIPKMALPPCHVMFQFYVRNGRLSCHMTQRSADVGLGLPFNIASYALLTHLVAYASELEAEELVVSVGDAHIYANHEGALLEQYFRTPKPFCRLVVAPGTPRDLFAIEPKDVDIRDYVSDEKLGMPLSV